MPFTEPAEAREVWSGHGTRSEQVLRAKRGNFFDLSFYEVAIGPAGSSRTQSDRRWLGSVTLARSRVRARAGYEFVSCRRHGDQRLPAGPLATSNINSSRSQTSN